MFVDAPPEYAVTVATPLWPVVISFTVTCPLWVRASTGSICPIVVVKLITVPFCTGVPAPVRVSVVPVPVPVPEDAWPFSMAVAMMSIELFSCAVSAAARSVEDRARGGQERDLVAAHHT